MNRRPGHIAAILVGLLVTFLWSTSFVIIKWGLSEIPPLTYAGLRYFLAALCFLPFYLRKQQRQELAGLSRKDILRLLILGVVFYSVTQGAQFIGLSLLPSATVSLVLNLTPIIVVALGILFLKENPTLRQWIGTVLFVVGVVVYFFPADLAASQWIGILVMVIGVSANAGATVLGRSINRAARVSPITVTSVSMFVGAILLVITGLAIEGVPSISAKSWGYLAWLAIVNTALAFTLWNVALRTLSAMEASIINGTMLVQIAILAWVFLGEQLTVSKIVGMAVVSVGAVLVQLRNRQQR